MMTKKQVQELNTLQELKFETLIEVKKRLIKIYGFKEEDYAEFVVSLHGEELEFIGYCENFEMFHRQLPLSILWNEGWELITNELHG